MSSHPWIKITDHPSTLPPLDLPVWVVLVEEYGGHTRRRNIVVACRSNDVEGWLWCRCWDNPYFDDNSISGAHWEAANAEIDDMNPTYWMELPELPDEERTGGEPFSVKCDFVRSSISMDDEDL